MAGIAAAMGREQHLHRGSTHLHRGGGAGLLGQAEATVLGAAGAVPPHSEEIVHEQGCHGAALEAQQVVHIAAGLPGSGIAVDAGRREVR